MQTTFSYLRALPGQLRGSLGALIWTGTLYRALGLVIFAPLTGFLLSWFLARTNRVVLIDQEIAAFLLEPMGAIAALVMLSVALTLIALEQGCLMTILHGRASGGVALGALPTLRFVLTRSPSVLSLASRILLRAVLLTLPFAAAAGLVYWWLLTEYDINYYLHEQPREYLLALTLGAFIGIGLLTVLLAYAARVILALPILLFEKRSPGDALAESARRIRGGRGQVIAFLIAWTTASLLLALLLGLPSLLVGKLLISGFSENTNAQMFIIGLLLVTLLFSELIASLLIAAAFSAAVIAVYEPRAQADLDWHGAVAAAPDSRQWSLSSGGLIAVVGLATICALVVGWIAVGETDVPDRSEVTAHRGSSGVAPENSMAAIERAIVDKADWVEIDVQRSADGIVVVVHDRDLQRLGGTDLVIGETPFAELADVDIGSWFDAAYSDQRIPTLTEVLAACHGRIGVNIELKYYGWDEALAPAVIEIVEQAGVADEVVLMSLDARAVRQAKSLRPDWKVGQLTAVAVGDLTRIEADFLAVHSGNLGPVLVRRAHASGKGLKVWTVNDAPGIHAMYSLGVDAIITDYPDKAAALRRIRADLGAAQRLLLGIGLLILDQPEHLDPDAEMAD